ncbi:MAG: PAS domain S-box protein [Pseudomonadota bacterium]
MTTVDDVLITAELALRPARAPDFAAENRALTLLAAEMASQPQRVLQKLAELVIELCHADSAGVSILEHDGDASLFRWHVTAGALAGSLGTVLPRDASPCGIVLERATVLLVDRPERCFPSLRGTGPPIHECLLAPWTAGGEPIGTVWVIAHSPERRFDAEDVRVLQSLAAYASAAHRTVTALADARQYRYELEQRVAERTRMLTESNARLQNEVDQRRQVESALLEAQAQLRAALSIETVGVLFLKLSGTIVDANPAFERMTGYRRDELLALPDWHSLTPPEFLEVTNKAAHELETRGHTAPFEKQMLRRDGSRFWGLFAPTRVADRGMESLCVEFILDIGAAKRAEAGLRESEARFRALADASPALIWQVDAEGKAVYFNQRYLEVVGLTPEQLLGHGWHAVLHPDDLHPYLETVEGALRRQARYQRRVRIRIKDNGWHPFDAHGAPWFGADGRFRGHVGICIDISATVQTEEALRDADRRKDEFLATLAHELRNPLAPISNAVHLLRHPEGRRASDRIVEMIDRQVRQMVRLVNDLMDVSRITRGKIGLSKAPVALADILASAIETSQPAIDGARHAFTVSLPAEPLTLQADKVRLTQVFANLLNNAAKYTDRGGRIWLEARRDGDAAEVKVRDTGIGIDAAALPHVFEMFAQAHAPSDRHQGGLGIGLTMVRQLVELHGGTVEAHSAGQGQGSEFVVRLPLRAGGDGAAPQPEGAAGAAALHGCRVLVADDNRDAADSLRLLLEMSGATVEVRYDGPAALSALDAMAAAPPRAVVLDIGMPGMDGYAVAQRIRADPRFASMKIIALTGWGQLVDRVRSKTSGIDHHLTKPVDWKSLESLLAGR